MVWPLIAGRVMTTYPPSAYSIRANIVVPTKVVDFTPLPEMVKVATAKTEVPGSTLDTIVSPVSNVTEAFAKVAVYCTFSSG